MLHHERVLSDWLARTKLHRLTIKTLLGQGRRVHCKPRATTLWYTSGRSLHHSKIVRSRPASLQNSQKQTTGNDSSMVARAVTQHNRNPRKEPLIPTQIPNYPRQKVATDLFTLKGLNYIVIADYFSHYHEVVQLQTTTTQSVVSTLKSIISRHGIPETGMSNNGPQFISLEFAEFATRYHFKHITSSPLHQTSNGEAERSVQISKCLLWNARIHS